MMVGQFPIYLVHNTYMIVYALIKGGRREGREDNKDKIIVVVRQRAKCSTK